MISMAPEDFAKLGGNRGGDATIMNGYKEAGKVFRDENRCDMSFREGSVG